MSSRPVPSHVVRPYFVVQICGQASGEWYNIHAGPINTYSVAEFMEDRQIGLKQVTRILFVDETGNEQVVGEEDGQYVERETWLEQRGIQ